MSYNIEEIPDEDYVYRQVLTFSHLLNGKSPRRFPNETQFELRDGEIGLSVNWDKYITVQDNFILLGLTHNKLGEYLEYTSFKIFKFPVVFPKKIEGIKDVLHKPIFNGNPAPLGLPNNQSHSEIVYENDEEIWLKLSDYCESNFDDAFCKFKVSSLNQEINKLRAQLQNSKFHIL